jgi:hypothetical protein
MAYLDTVGNNHFSDVYDFPISTIRQLREERPDVYEVIRELRNHQALKPVRVVDNMVHMFASKYIHGEDWYFQWDLNMDSMRLEKTVLLAYPPLLYLLSLDIPERLQPGFLRKRRKKAKEDRFARRLWDMARLRYTRMNYRENLNDGLVDRWAADIAEARGLEDAMGQPSMIFQIPFTQD